MLMVGPCQGHRRQEVKADLSIWFDVLLVSCSCDISAVWLSITQKRLEATLSLDLKVDTWNRKLSKLTVQKK